MTMTRGIETAHLADLRALKLQELRAGRVRGVVEVGTGRVRDGDDVRAGLVATVRKTWNLDEHMHFTGPKDSAYRAA